MQTDTSDNSVDLPLISLQPVVDDQHGWVAMWMREPQPDDAAQARLFEAGGLAEALDGLPCIVPAFGLGGAASDANSGYLRRIPAAPINDAAAPTVPTVPLPADLTSGPCLAMGVESFSAFERCRKIGFTWFAGNYALHPMPGMVARNAARHALVLQLLTLLTHDADTHELEGVVKQDPQLSYQLLRLVNSVAYSPGHQITSFNHAISMLGRKPMQRWLQLLLYARPEGAGRSPLLPRAAKRGALLESLFPANQDEVREQAFMVGMFSLLDVMLNERMTKLLAPLRLAGEVSRALIERSGMFGPALRAIEADEKGDAPLAPVLAEAGIAPAVWIQALIRSCHWSVRVSREA